MFCPLRSTAEKEIECSQDCAIYTEETQSCAILSLVRTLDETNEKLDSLDSTIFHK